MPQEMAELSFLASNDDPRIMISGKPRLLNNARLSDCLSFVPAEIPSKIPIVDSFLIHAFVCLESMNLRHMFHKISQFPTLVPI